jgi:hypothetical protein
MRPIHVEGVFFVLSTSGDRDITALSSVLDLSYYFCGGAIYYLFLTTTGSYVISVGEQGAVSVRLAPSGHRTPDTGHRIHLHIMILMFILLKGPAVLHHHAMPFEFVLVGLWRLCKPVLELWDDVVFDRPPNLIIY